MLSIAAELEDLINQHLQALQSIHESDFSFKPSPAKWSKKEILGHLIDSAENNIRRFIVTQYDDKPHIVYRQDFWVAASGYQNWNTPDIINHWYLANKKICNLLRNIPEAVYHKECMTNSLHSIEWLAEDYVKHLKHHLHQVLNLEPVGYP